MYKALLNMLLGKDPTAIKVPFTSLLTTAQWGKILNLVFCTNLLDGLTSSIQNQGCG